LWPKFSRENGFQITGKLGWSFLYRTNKPGGNALTTREILSSASLENWMPTSLEESASRQHNINWRITNEVFILTVAKETKLFLYKKSWVHAKDASACFDNLDKACEWVLWENFEGLFGGNDDILMLLALKSLHSSSDICVLASSSKPKLPLQAIHEWQEVERGNWYTNWRGKRCKQTRELHSFVTTKWELSYSERMSVVKEAFVPTLIYSTDINIE